MVSGECSEQVCGSIAGSQARSMPTTNSTGHIGRDLRSAREALGITRAQLAALAGCSLASLDAIEQGAVPRRSRVLTEAVAALERFRNAQAGSDDE